MSAIAISAGGTGFAFGCSLIVAIGPQNAFVLRQGARREHVGTVVAVCAISDLLLIAAGVAGAGAALDGNQTLRLIARIGGAVCLALYALLAARRAARPGRLAADGTLGIRSRRTVITSSLVFTWLNPAVYLDTVVLLGTIASSQHERWIFGAGAGVASVLWFAALGFGARLLTPVLSSARAWRVLDGSVAAVMTLTAVRVLAGA